MELITSLQNPLVKHLVRLRQNRDYREEHRSLFLEGEKMVKEVGGRFPPQRLVVSDERLIPREIQAKEIILVNEPVMKKISGMQNPEGIVAEFSMPPNMNLSGMSRILAFDSINDPGNLGSLFRSAYALGWQGVFLHGDCCDPFNEKTIRASRGAVFYLPFTHGSIKDLKKLIANNQLTPFLADVKGNSADAIDIPNQVLLVLGNEAHGASEDVRNLCTPLTIPMPGEMESLNVAAAGAILLYLLRQNV